MADDLYLDPGAKILANYNHQDCKLTQTMHDSVNHPGHYISANGIEAIDVIEAFTADLTGVQATDTGNIIKYILRWHNKNGVEDLKKAQWYLNHLIANIEKEN